METIRDLIDENLKVELDEIEAIPYDEEGFETRLSQVERLHKLRIDELKMLNDIELKKEQMKLDHETKQKEIETEIIVENKRTVQKVIDLVGKGLIIVGGGVLAFAAQNYLDNKGYRFESTGNFVSSGTFKERKRKGFSIDLWKMINM